MNRILLAIVLLSVIAPSTVNAWTFPLDLDPIAMKFNFNTSSTYTDDALTIMTKSGTQYQDIVAPEWTPTQSKKFAYKRKTDQSSGYPKIEVKFHVNGPDTTPLTIDAVNTVGAQWALQGTAVTFDGFGWSTGTNNYVRFNSDSSYTIPGSVGKHTVYWSWRVTAVNGVPRTPYIFASTNHTFYTLYDAPVSPWTSNKTWDTVLDYACVWASGETTASNVVEEITEGAYNSGFKNYYGGTTHLNGTQFALDAMLGGTQVDCRDMAAVVQTFSNALGVPNVHIKYIDDVKDNDDDGFYYKLLDPIGSTSPCGGDEDGWWCFHCVGWYNSTVYDACVKLYNTTRVPVGEALNTTYKEDIYNNNPNSGWTHFYDNQWYPLSGYSTVNGIIDTDTD